MIEFLNQDLTLLIFAMALLTFATRFLGYAVLAKFENIHPRVDAALRAIPAAVITALVVPPALTSGWVEIITLIIVAIVCVRFSALLALILGLAFLILSRYYFGL